MIGVYRYEFEVSENCIDGNRHMNNVAYLRLMQDAAVEHANRSGCAAATFEAGATWFVRSHFIEYLRPALLGDTVAILTWVVNFKGARSLRKYKFIRTSDKTILATGQTDWVFVDARSGWPRRIPDRVKETLPFIPDGDVPS